MIKHLIYIFYVWKSAVYIFRAKCFIFFVHAAASFSHEVEKWKEIVSSTCVSIIYVLLIEKEKDDEQRMMGHIACSCFWVCVAVQDNFLEGILVLQFCLLLHQQIRWVRPDIQL